MNDTTIPTINSTGKLHPLSVEIIGLREIMYRSGFIEEETPMIDSEEYNFDALNVGKMHPARGMHDTFYLNNGELLRTHTSTMEPRVLEHGKYKTTTNDPFATFQLGRVYRRDASDRTHMPMFHHLEGMFVGKTHLGELKGFLDYLLSAFFQKKIEFRFRPSYFPFTEPSVEVDIKISGKWLEVCGGGMLRRNILERYGYSSDAYAFGMGVERLVMIKYEIDNIQDLYKNPFPFMQNYGVNL